MKGRRHQGIAIAFKNQQRSQKKALAQQRTTKMATKLVIKLGITPVMALMVFAFGFRAVRAQSIDSYGLSEQVRKQLVTLPYYGVFDNLEYKIDGATVTLSGQVVRPSTRSDAGASIKRIPGV